MTGGENEADRGLQRLRPEFDGAQRRARPVKCTNASAHFAGAQQKLSARVAVRCDHPVDLRVLPPIGTANTLNHCIHVVRTLPVALFYF